MVADMSAYLDREPRTLAEAERDQLKRVVFELFAACKHAAMSEHHPTCKHTHPNRCSCHVAKARAALETARQVTGTTPED